MERHVPHAGAGDQAHSDALQPAAAAGAEEEELRHAAAAQPASASALPHAAIGVSAAVGLDSPAMGRSDSALIKAAAEGTSPPVSQSRSLHFPHGSGPLHPAPPTTRGTEGQTTQAQLHPQAEGTTGACVAGGAGSCMLPSGQYRHSAPGLPQGPTDTSDVQARVVEAAEAAAAAVAAAAVAVASGTRPSTPMLRRPPSLTCILAGSAGSLGINEAEGNSGGHVTPSSFPGFKPLAGEGDASGPSDAAQPQSQLQSLGEMLLSLQDRPAGQPTTSLTHGLFSFLGPLPASGPAPPPPPATTLQVPAPLLHASTAGMHASGMDGGMAGPAAWQLLSMDPRDPASSLPASGLVAVHAVPCAAAPAAIALPAAAVLPVSAVLPAAVPPPPNLLQMQAQARAPSPQLTHQTPQVLLHQLRMLQHASTSMAAPSWVLAGAAAATAATAGTGDDDRALPAPSGHSAAGAAATGSPGTQNTQGDNDNGEASGAPSRSRGRASLLAGGGSTGGAACEQSGHEHSRLDEGSEHTTTCSGPLPASSTKEEEQTTEGLTSVEGTPTPQGGAAMGDGEGTERKGSGDSVCNAGMEGRNHSGDGVEGDGEGQQGGRSGRQLSAPHLCGHKRERVSGKELAGARFGLPLIRVGIKACSSFMAVCGARVGSACRTQLAASCSIS